MGPNEVTLKNRGGFHRPRWLVVCLSKRSSELIFLSPGYIVVHKDAYRWPKSQVKGLGLLNKRYIPGNSAGDLFGLVKK